MNNERLLIAASVVFLGGFIISFLLLWYRNTLKKRERSKRWVAILSTAFQVITVIALAVIVNVLLRFFSSDYVNQESAAVNQWMLDFFVFLVVIAVTMLVAVFVRRNIAHHGIKNDEFVAMVVESAIDASYRRAAKKKKPIPSPEEAQINNEKKLEKRKKKNRLIKIIVIAVTVWLVISLLITLIFGKLPMEMEFSLFPLDVAVGPFMIPESIVVSWILMAIITGIALIIRIFVIPRFTSVPKTGIQNVLELAVDTLAKYTKNMSDVSSRPLNVYIFGVTIFMLFCTATEFFGVRSPLTDLRMTGTLAMVTFLLLNYYGFKKKGFGGRMKSLASPSPIIFPIRVISDLASPVSLACRLFGNMVGGMIVIELLYFALGNFSAGIPGVLGLYFNIFEPIVQIYIFITLTLNYIREAVE